MNPDVEVVRRGLLSTATDADAVEASAALSRLEAEKDKWERRFREEKEAYISMMETASALEAENERLRELATSFCYRCHKDCGPGDAYCVDGADHVWAAEVIARLRHIEEAAREVLEAEDGYRAVRRAGQRNALGISALQPAAIDRLYVAVDALRTALEGSEPSNCTCLRGEGGVLIETTPACEVHGPYWASLRRSQP